MSGGFELQPLDCGPRVALAPGETVIGRGPLLGVSVEGARRPREPRRPCEPPPAPGPACRPGSVLPLARPASVLPLARPAWQD
jgi:hypothetical protein